MAIGRVVGVGREFRWPPKENHTKGGMKKLLLCTKYHAHTVPKPYFMRKIVKNRKKSHAMGCFYGNNSLIVKTN